MNFKTFFLTVFMMLSVSSKAGFYFQHSFSYLSESEDTESLEYSTMRNLALLGAGFGKKGQWVIGQSIYAWSRSSNNSVMNGVSDISMLELGPRVQYFLNDAKNFYLSGTYNFYAKGSRTVNGGASQDIEGTSYLISAGLQLKVTRKFFFGLSYNYHALSISETSTGTTTADVTQSYTNAFPALEFSLRFR